MKIVNLFVYDDCILRADIPTYVKASQNILVKKRVYSEPTFDITRPPIKLSSYLQP